MHEYTDASAYAVVHFSRLHGVGGTYQNTYHDTVEDANLYAYELWNCLSVEQKLVDEVRVLCISKVFDPNEEDLDDLWECEDGWNSEMADYRSVDSEGKRYDTGLNKTMDPWRLLGELKAEDWSNETAEDALSILENDVVKVFKYDLAPSTWCDPECDTIIQPGMTADKLYYAEYVMYGNAKTTEQINSIFFHRMRSVSFEIANKRWEGY